MLPISIPHLTESYTNKFPRTRHINHIKLQGDHDNNKMEQMNGEIRVRKNTKSLKKVDTPILKGLQEKKTPAEKAGIQIEGDNKG